MSFSLFSKAVTAAKPPKQTVAAPPAAAPVESKSVEETEAAEEARPAGFAELGIGIGFVNQTRVMGLTRPTPVQAACIPPIIAGMLVVRLVV